MHSTLLLVSLASALVLGASTAFITPPAAFVTPPAAFVTPPAAFVTPPAAFVTPPAAFVTPPAAFVAPPAEALAGGLIKLSGGPQKDKVASKRYLKTRFTVTDDGKLTAYTDIKSKHKLKGFTGGVNIILLDKSKNELWMSQLHKWGVNCKWCGKNERHETWTEQVPLEAVRKAKMYVIWQRHTPTNRVFKWIKEHLPQIIQAAKYFI